MIDAVRRLVIKAGTALRAVPKVFEIFTPASDPAACQPSASGARWWLLRLGLYTLRATLPVATDWIYLIDHSVQIGTVKVFVITGIRASSLPTPPRPLVRADLHLLALIPTEHSNGDIVTAQLNETAKRTGIPRAIVSDHGSDVKKGSEQFAAEHPGSVTIYDAAHFGAILLKRRLEAHPQWSRLITRLGQTKAKLLQTSDACLASPSLRPKARYMNLGPLLKWCRQILLLLDRDPETSPASQRAHARYSWLEEFRGAIGAWSRWECTVSTSVAFVRSEGLSADCAGKLAVVLQTRPPEQRHAALESEWIRFAREQSSGLAPSERLVGSTEVLESVFGKWKSLERQESRSGITSLVLSLGSLLGDWPLPRLQAALNQTPVKAVMAWLETHFPPSVQSQRRLTFSPVSP